MRKTVPLFPLILSAILLCLLAPPPAGTGNEKGRRPSDATPRAHDSLGLETAKVSLTDPPEPGPLAITARASVGVESPPPEEPAAPGAPEHTAHAGAAGAAEPAAPLPGLWACDQNNLCGINFDNLATNTDVRDIFEQIKFSYEFEPGTALTLKVDTCTPDNGCTQASSRPHSIAGGTGNFVIDFPSPVAGFGFVIGSVDNGAGFIAQIRYYNGATLLGTLDVPTRGRRVLIPVAFGQTRLTKVKVVNITDADGFSYDDFTWSMILPGTAGSLRTSSVTMQQVVLQWNAGPDATSYRVQRSRSATGGWQNIGDTAQTTFTDTRVEQGVRYFYRVYSNNLGGWSNPTGALQVEVPLPAPTLLHLTTFPFNPEKYSKLDVVWNMPVGVDEILIKRSKVSGRDYQVVAAVSMFPGFTMPPGESNWVLEVDELDTHFYYVVAAVRNGIVSPNSNEISVTNRQDCGYQTLPVPPPHQLRHFTWSMRAEVTPHDGLVVKDVMLRDRYISAMMSVPYLNVHVRGRDGFMHILRVELTPDNPTPTQHDINRVRARLVAFNPDHPDEDSMGRMLKGVSATYIVDRLFPGSVSCLKITQKYLFGFEEPGGCELSSTLPCARLYPKVEYEFEGKGRETLLSITIPQRIHNRIETSAASTVGLFRDCDTLPVIVPVPQPGPVPVPVPIPTCFQDDPQTSLVFEKAEHPVKDERTDVIVLQGRNQKAWDNVHQTNEDAVGMPFPADLGPLSARAKRVLGGCPECFHSHWRWGASAATLVDFFNKMFGRPAYVGRPDFGGGNLIGFGGDNKGQDFALSVVRHRDSAAEIHPLDYKTLVNGENLWKRAAVPPSTIEQTHKQDTVLWYATRGFYKRGSTFEYGAFANWDKGLIAGVIQPGPQTGAAASFEEEVEGGAPSAPATTGDGPTNVTYQRGFKEGPTTYTTFDPNQVGPLPQGYTHFNNTGYEIKTEAAASGEIVVTFTLPSAANQTDFNKLRVLQAEVDPFDPKKGVWLDRTILAPDPRGPNFTNKTVRVRTTRLGLFVVASLSGQTYTPKSADVGVSAVQSSASIQPNGMQTYTVTVSNHGPEVAAQVGLVNSLSPDVAFISVAPVSLDCKFDHGSVYCKLGALAVGASKTVTVSVVPVEYSRNRFPAEGQPIGFTAYAAPVNDLDPNGANNTAQLSATAQRDPNGPPTARVTSPDDGATLVGPANITVTAEASDADGSVTSVEFLGDGKSIGAGQMTSPGQYRFTWNNVGFGPHSVRVVATDNGGRKEASDPIIFIVNGPAAVNITGPRPGSFLAPNSAATVTASVTHPSGTVRKVEFFANERSLGEVNASAGQQQFTLSWANVPRGIYELAAVATDTAGVLSFSDPVKVFAIEQSGVAITQPADATSFTGGSQIEFKAQVSNTGEVPPRRVEFFVNGTLLGEGAPAGANLYSFLWLGPADGFYSVTAVATDAGGLQTASRSVNVAVNTPGLVPGEYTWVNDALPPGARPSNERDGWHWVESNPAPVLGAKSHQSLIADGSHLHSFDGATLKMPVNPGDKLFTYVFLHPGYMPQEVMLEWKDDAGWEHRAYWSNEQQSRVRGCGGTTPGCRRVGPLPLHSRWVRLEVPAELVGLDGKLVNGMSFAVYGGRATWDRAGKSDRAFVPPTASDTVWFDDALPAGAVAGEVHDDWFWVPQQSRDCAVRTPRQFSGSSAHQTFFACGGDDDPYRAHYFAGATARMQVNPGDVLYAYAFMDASNKPDQLVLRWHDGTNWYGAYWGASYTLVGEPGTETMRYMGELPAAGEWVRLEVPASYVGLEGKLVGGMYFGMHRRDKRGLVTWDQAGKSTRPPRDGAAALYVTAPFYRYFRDAVGFFYHPTDRHNSAEFQPGVRWYAHTSRAAGTVPLHRYRHSTSGQYLYHVLPPNAEGAYPPSPSWRIDWNEFDKGVAFYVYPKDGPPPPGGVELHQYFKDGKYFYTIFKGETVSLPMQYEGVVGYVFQSRPVISPVDNPVDDQSFFVRQHYLDFLNREPDLDGLGHWTGEITQCTDPSRRLANESLVSCYGRKRVDVSGAFFLSIEFQETGYLVYRLYNAALSRPPEGLLRFDEFLRDAAEMGQGLVVGSEGWQLHLENNKVAFLNKFVARSEFASLYPANLTPEQYVDKLYAQARLTPTPGERQAAVGEFSSGTSQAARARVLRKVAESPALSARETNRAFVLMQYFGYLRRDPDAPPDRNLDGWRHWLGKLITFNGDWRRAEMVRAFIESIEYRARFGQPVTSKSVSNITAGLSTVSAGAVTVNFSGAASGGEVQSTHVYPGSLAPEPHGYKFYPNLAWQLTTTSSAVPASIKVNLEGVFNDPAEFAGLRLLQLQGDVWVDRTILPPDAPAPDFATRTISARVTSLAPVAVARLGGATATDLAVSITAPAHNQTFTAPTDLSMSATVTGQTGGVTKVEFFADGEPVGEDTTAPYALTWLSAPPGSHVLTARVTDLYGRSATSPAVNVVVNDRPAVFVSSPGQDAVFDYPASVTVTAFANDGDGIKQVEFFRGTTSLGVDTTSPYSVNWPSPAVGSHTLTARATDNRNTTMTSAAVAVTVRNLAPTVAITSPAAGAAVGNAPATFTITAAASDSNGIKRVEFYSNGTLLGTDAAAPYAFTYSNAPVGGYSLTAKAFDNFDASKTSAAVGVTVGNAAPAVSITSPASGANLGSAPATVTVQAAATDNEGVKQVEFFRGTTSLGVDTTAPYSVTWANAAAGPHVLTAKATDNLNAVTTSTAVNVNVTNAPPTVSITGPAAGTNYTGPATIAIQAAAADHEGVRKVEFFQGATKLGEDTTAPYGFTWSGAAAGSYSLTAKATDNLDAVTTSGSVAVTVSGPLFTLFSDNFDDNSLDPIRWAVMTPGAQTQVFERNQRLELIPPNAAAVTDYNGVMSVSTIDMTNAQATVELTQYAPGFGHEAYFRLIDPATNQYVMFDVGGGGLILQDSVTGQAGRTVISSYTVAHYRHWRFRHVPATDKLLWESSADGHSWTTLRSITRSFAITGMQVRLVAGHYAGVDSPAGTTVFDNLEVESAVANTAPAVSVTSPAAGAVFNAPATATVTAAASDGDGGITRVEFYAGTTSLGVDTTAPYSAVVSNAVAGTYSLTARAYDNRGGVTTSAPVVITVNSLPSVSMTAPAAGSTYQAPAAVTLGATASDADGTVSKVEFFQNGVLLAADTAAPYSFTWSGVAAGGYALTARATDNRGAVSTSAAVSVTVNPPNVAPSVSVTSPPGGSLFDAPASLGLQASASDSDGSVASVEFFRNGVSLGVDATAPYSFNWTGVAAGNYSLTAKATDNSGAATHSAAVGITVVTPSLLPRADTIGVYTGNTFHLRNSNSAGPANVSTVYGTAGWTPVVGDWDGNGTATLGVFVPDAGQQGYPGQSVFYLSNRLDSGSGDTTVVFGVPGDRPVAGDWDGNGTVTVGVYRPSNYTFYLRNANSAGPADITVTLPSYYGETPVAGDWDGDGVDTVGMHNSATATFYLRNANTPGPLDVTVGFGNMGDAPVAGDWDGDGKTTVGSFKGSSATFYLRNQNTTGPADLVIQYGTAGNSIPVAGNWDGTRAPCCGDAVWFDDALPAGAVPAGVNESWVWAHSNPVPFSGRFGHKSAAGAGEHGHYFTAATETMTIAAGEKLFAYVYLDPASPPDEVMLQWHDGDWEHRAYWGANSIPLGVDGTESRRHVGPLPPAGQWVRLEVPASQVGLEGVTVSGMAFKFFDGAGTWDRAGKTTADAPNVFVSEFRLRGAAGPGDEFVELYNNSDSPLSVCATDGSGGWAVVASDGLTRFVVPDGTVIPAYGHYLGTGPNYSLAAYAASDKSYSKEIPDNAGLALFDTANPFGFASSNRLDAAGFNSVTNPLFFEGTGLTPAGTVNGEFSFARVNFSGPPQETNNNAGDFMFVSNTGDTFGGTVASFLGGAGPENLLSPLRRDSSVPSVLLDPAVAASVAPNRVRFLCPDTPDCNPTTAPNGTLVIRRQVVNNTGKTLTRLRFRITNVTTLNSPGYTLGGTQADMRVLSSSNTTVTLTNGSTVTVYGTTLEQPPNQPNGGGHNSTLRVPLPAGGLPPGAAINVQFSLGVKQSGSFRFFLIPEAL